MMCRRQLPTTANMRCKISTFLASTSLATSCAAFVQHTTPYNTSVFAVKRTFSNRIAKCTQNKLNQSRDNSTTTSLSVTLETIVDSLKKGEYKKVLVVAGAGVSVSAGIPDVSALLAGCLLYINYSIAT